MDYAQLPIIFFIEVFVLIFFAILTYVFFAIWIYKDCKIRGESPLLWLLLFTFVSNFLGLIIYLIVRKEKKQVCKSCGCLISSSAKYCESCGLAIENSNDIQQFKQTSNRKYIIAGIVSFCMIFICVIAIIITGLTGFLGETNVISKFEIWNTGFETISRENKSQNSWDLSLKSATEGFVKETKMDITNPDEQVLYLEATCDITKEGGNLMLWIVQGDTVKSIDVTNLGEVLEYPLNEFEKGEVFVRLQINNVKNVKSNIIIE